MKKRLLQTFFLCLLLAVLLTVSAGAVITSGTWGDNITWTLDNDGVLTFSGTGEMMDSGGHLPDWLSYSAEIRAVVISEGITSIVSEAFLECENLTTINFSSTVTRIGEAAFRQCSALTEITIPGTVETIENFAFCRCPALKKATIENGVKTIGVRIFEDCTSLTEINVPGSVRSLDTELCITWGTNASPIRKAIIPSGFPESDFCVYPPFSSEFLEEVTIIGNTASIPRRSFVECKNLKKVTILDGVTTLEESAFDECENLTEVYLPASLTTIGMCAFRGCEKLENCVIPDSVTSIGREAFSSCTALRKVILPRGLAEIEMGTFDETRLEELYIPLNVTKIAAYAISDSRDAKTGQVRGQLKDVYYEGSGEQWRQMDIGQHNNLLSDATMHYNATMPPIILPTPSTSPAPSNETAFEDIPADAYYADAVNWAVERGVTNGVSATNFAPADICNRGQVATFLWRANGSPEPVTTENPFTDVDPSSAFYKAILWAAENGITAGTSESTFSPGNPCTRAHVVTFLWRAQGRPAPSGEGSLADSFPQGYYTDAVRWADAAGLLSGTGEAFTPSALCPRADIVTYLYRNLA